MLHMPQALTTSNVTDQARLLSMLLKTQCDDGLMHESVDASNLQACTRPHFEWANAMLVVVVESLLGRDCDAEAERLRLELIPDRETSAAHSQMLQQQLAAVVDRPKDDDDPLFYERLEQTVALV